MPRPPANSIFSVSEADQNGETRLSLEEFSTIVQSHLIRIDRIQHSLQSALIPLTIENCNVQPVQCEKAIKSLDEMNVPIRGFCTLLHQTQRLPIVFTALRYQLLFNLHRVEEQTNRLVNLIKSYRVICTSSSKYAQRLQREISASFEVLLLYIADISRQVIFLDDEAKFQERKIAAKLEKKSSIDKTNSDFSGRFYIVKQHEDTINVS
jgi:hypothetical protein